MIPTPLRSFVRGGSMEHFLHECRNSAGLHWMNRRKYWLLTPVVFLGLLVVYSGYYRTQEANLRHKKTYYTSEESDLSNTEVDIGHGMPYGGQSWRQLVASWDHQFSVRSKVEGEVVNPYPDEVRFLLQETDACQDPPLVLAMVVTAVTNRHRRRFIRHTWGHPALTQVTGVKPLFIMGQAKDPKLQAVVESESKQNRDVIQANFVDSYRNLTYKTTALLTWAAENCPHSPILLKIDDDVIPNPLALQDFLLAYLQDHPHPTRIMGKVRCCDLVLREGKWGVPKDIYPGNEYPTYVAGPSYMVPTALIPALLQAVRRTRFLFLEDVYTTGLAAKTGGIHHYSILSLSNSLSSKMDYLWCSGARVFQENVNLKEATRGWNALLKLENITNPPPYVLPSFQTL